MQHCSEFAEDFELRKRGGQREVMKEFLCVDKDLLFITSYVPPYQSPYLQTIVGGLNARIGNWNLTSKYTYNVFTDVDSGESQRQSQDKQDGKRTKNPIPLFIISP